MKCLVKSLLKVQVCNDYRVTLVYRLVHFLRELRKTGETGLLFAETMPISPHQGLVPLSLKILYLITLIFLGQALGWLLCNFLVPLWIPFSKTGVTFPTRQSSGIASEFSDRLHVRVIRSTVSHLSSLRTLRWIPSGPGDFIVFLITSTVDLEYHLWSF